MLKHALRCSRNLVRQRIHPGEKIFFIGFNKTGTTALHHLMDSHYIRSVHWAEGKLADTIEALHSDKIALRKYLAGATAYSDILSLTDDKLIEANRHFRLFHELFPEAYFVLNDRDIDAWVRSREAHRKGTFMTRSMSALNVDAETARAIWIRTHIDHSAEVLDYFSGHPRFLHFRVDRDPVKILIDLLAPSFDLHERGWHQINVTRAAPSNGPEAAGAC